MYHRILVALDGSAASKLALHAAVELAATAQATVCALGVEERLTQYEMAPAEIEEDKAEQDDWFAEIMDEARREANERGVALETAVQSGNAAQRIIQTARDGHYDLIVLGAKGHSVIRDFLLGTTTDRVAHHAPCSVLVVR